MAKHGDRLPCRTGAPEPATGTIGSSFRSYYEVGHQVDVPAGITLSPEDRGYPREYGDPSHPDIRQWTGPTRGATSPPS